MPFDVASKKAQGSRCRLTVRQESTRNLRILSDWRLVKVCYSVSDKKELRIRTGGTDSRVLLLLHSHKYLIAVGLRPANVIVALPFHGADIVQYRMGAREVAAKSLESGGAGPRWAQCDSIDLAIVVQHAVIGSSDVRSDIKDDAAGFLNR